MTHPNTASDTQATWRTKVRTFHWMPRILGILAILFISMFALDAFEGDHPLGEKIVGFLIHLIPSYVLTAMLLIAWKWEKVGGIMFIFIGLAFTPIIFLHNYNMNQSIGMSLVIILTITMPFVLVGALFLVSHRIKLRAKGMGRGAWSVE